MQDSDVFFLTNGNKTLSGVDELNCPAELRIPSGVTKIDKRSLADCPANKIFIPDTVTEIGFEAFSGCDALEYVRMPKNLQSVGPAIFRGCLSLTKVEMGDTITNFSESMFELCPSLKDVPFRNGITELPRNVFSECTSIESLVIPEGVAVIKSGTAAYCESLTTVVLPSSIKIIEDDAFHGCPNLAHIRFNGESPAFFIDEDTGCLFGRREDGNLTLIKVPVNATEIRIPKNVTHSHSEAFQNCDALEKVFIDCSVVDHPLFVALKTEIVNAEIIDETQIKHEEKTTKQKKPVEDFVTQKTVDFVIEQSTPQEEEQGKPEKEKKIRKPKKTSMPKAKKTKTKAKVEEVAAEEAIDFEIQEPEMPEPEEPNTDSLILADPIIEEPIEQETEETSVEAPVIDEPVVEEPIAQDPLADNPIIDEPAIEEESAMEDEASEESTPSEEDIISNILEQNIGADETPEEKEELKGITITIDELDAAMMRGIQNEVKEYKIPKGIFPPKPGEEPEEELPPQEPRFVNGMTSVSATSEIIDERTLYPDRAEADLCQTAPIEMEDITTLVVVTQSVTADNKISEGLKDFCIDLARKHSLIRVYLFGALALDNDEFLYGFVKFALCRNVIYATNAADFDSLSTEIKSFAEIAEINSPVTPFQNVANESTLELEKPFKIFVQDNLKSTSTIKTEEENMSTTEETQDNATEKGFLAKAKQIQEKASIGKGFLARAQAALDSQK